MMAKSTVAELNRPLVEMGALPKSIEKPDVRKSMLSVITPIYGEEESIDLLLANVLPVLRNLGQDFEIIAVNDGSHDASLQVLRSASARIPELRAIDFRRNYGQTAAIMAGIDYAVGDVLITIDADLQNDPADIPALLDKLNEGYD